MFQIKKIGVNPDGSLNPSEISVFSEASSNGSLTSGLSLYSGASIKVPMIVSYEGSEDAPILSDIIMSLSCMLSSSSFSQDYSFERYDSNSNYVYFKHIETEKLVKCRVFVPNASVEINELQYLQNFNVNNLSNFTQACPDDSGYFYISNSTDFSEDSLFFILDFVFDAKFVPSYNSNLLFQLGLNIVSLTSSSVQTVPPFAPSPVVPT